MMFLQRIVGLHWTRFGFSPPLVQRISSKYYRANQELISNLAPGKLPRGAELARIEKNLCAGVRSGPASRPSRGRNRDMHITNRHSINTARNRP
jgi:hypothetical protein